MGFITGCLAGMDRRPSPHRENWAVWVSPQAVHSAAGPCDSVYGLLEPEQAGELDDERPVAEPGEPVIPVAVRAEDDKEIAAR